MPGALSTLGLGSQGVLTNDLLDKLKDADKAGSINPIERKQKSLKLQQAGLTGLKDSISKLSDLALSLSDATLYKNTTSTITGDHISVTSSPDAKAQNLSIRVWNIATRDIQESKTFASKTDPLDAGTMNLEIDGKSYDITIEDTDTLETLAQKISDQTEGKIDASVMNVGGNKPFELILKSTETGKQNHITVTGDMEFTQVGEEAQDASLRVDGIMVHSASNDIKDIVEGVDISILKADRTTETITIKQDNDKISDKVEEFVTQYNELLNSVKTMTNYNPDTKVGGVFQGTSEIKNMLGPLRDVFASTISSTGQMAEDFGIKADKSGILTFDRSTFSKKLNENTEAVQNFFVGKGEEKGIFRELDSKIFDIKKSDGILKSLKSNFDSKSLALSDQLDRAKKRLESKYEIIQRRFASFDAVIGRLSNASDTLTSLIESQNKK